MNETPHARCNVENMTKWILALEQGGYEQTKGCLARRNFGVTRYCCLGVATAVAMENGLKFDIEFDEDREEGDGSETATFSWRVLDRYRERVVYEHDVLPGPVQEWLGIDSANPELPDIYEDDDHEDGRETEQATALNDDLGWDFEAIAGALRRKYGIPRVDPNRLTL